VSPESRQLHGMSGGEEGGKIEAAWAQGGLIHVSKPARSMPSTSSFSPGNMAAGLSASESGNRGLGKQGADGDHHSAPPWRSWGLAF